MVGQVKELKDFYVVETWERLSTEPKLVIHQYRITSCNGQINLDKPWVTYNSGTWRGSGYEVGTSKEPTSHSVEEIPCPKTKLKTRWNEYQCQWEKYSKSRGWISAE